MKTEKTVTRDSLNKMLDEINKVRRFHQQAQKYLAQAEKDKAEQEYIDFQRTAVNSSRADIEFNANSFARKISALVATLDDSKLRELVNSLPIPAK